jgi:hypothetical protein
LQPYGMGGFEEVAMGVMLVCRVARSEVVLALTGRVRIRVRC